MTAMLKVFFVAAFVAVAHAGIADYSKEAIKQIFSLGPESKPAQLINGDISIEFKKNNGEPITLLAVASLNPEKKDKECGSDLGVVINGETNCILSTLSVKQVNKSGKQGLQLNLVFKLQSEPIVLAVPILKVPESSSSSQKWVTENNVDLAPADIEQLSNYKKDEKSVKISFKWLSSLLAGGVTQSTEESASVMVNKFNINCKPYFTKALVVPGDVAQKLAAIVSK